MAVPEISNNRMIDIEFVAADLFKSILEINFDGELFDLHNEYDCYSVVLSKDRDLTLSFKSDVKECKLVFKDSTLNYMNLSLTDLIDITTIDTIYRGRYENGNELRELTEDSRGYYYIEFYSGYTLELFARSVFFVTS
ncbi:MAG: hypothetical protein EOO47_26420 [Flavobacterium sp.]|nr:MAG: hypothetical protein EOO47_26420 [Flavobacterium sp.]